MLTVFMYPVFVLNLLCICIAIMAFRVQSQDENKCLIYFPTCKIVRTKIYGNFGPDSNTKMCCCIQFSCETYHLSRGLEQPKTFNEVTLLKNLTILTLYPTFYQQTRGNWKAVFSVRQLISAIQDDEDDFFIVNNMYINIYSIFFNIDVTLVNIDCMARDPSTYKKY